MIDFLGFLGWVLLIAALFTLVRAFRRPGGAPVAERARRGPDRRYLAMGAAGIVLGVLLAMAPRIALARMRSVDLSRVDNWRFNPATGPEAPLRWEGSKLVGTLEVGSAHYAVFPVDWEANRFAARWDITFTQLDPAEQEIQLKDGDKTRMARRGQLERASVAIGLMDQNAANIDDRDHVSGSAIEACFSDDIRLRASDANYLVRTSSSTESGKADIDPDFKPTAPVRVDLNRKYHCALSYDGRSKTADLLVRDESGREVVRRQLEDLKDFTNSVAWFGVSVRGYNRFNKKLDAKKADNGYARPKGVVRLENMRYRQP